MDPFRRFTEVLSDLFTVTIGLCQRNPAVRLLCGPLPDLAGAWRLADSNRGHVEQPAWHVLKPSHEPSDERHDLYTEDRCGHRNAKQ